MPQDPGSEQYAGTSLRLQVLEIIASLLNSTGPELEEVRVRLRNLVREHPWDPEVALLLHLSGVEKDIAALPKVVTPATQPPAVQATALAGEPSRGDGPGFRSAAGKAAPPPSLPPSSR
ncbi:MULTISPECIES: hypothetical protein [unclassified Arthrobacter]|uniref:hypothetical protein n=1 Tax=unclassified Arthrobacter TaxID=235627 RepID=UPI0027D8DD0B|nr:MULTISPECIES: hypothetical protein [unclassified Arthrobacter]